jgi:hypothetical protein
MRFLAIARNDKNGAIFDDKKNKIKNNIYAAHYFLQQHSILTLKMEKYGFNVIIPTRK